jgi:glycosyltransferase involved in cell wall biosynthesis
VSVIIPSYNRQSTLANVVAMAAQQDYVDYEVVVVDQTGTDSSVLNAALASAGDHIRYFRLDRPNLPAARNFGVTCATGEIVLFLDDDVEIGNDYISRHAAHFTDASIGAVMGLITPASHWVEENLIATVKNDVNFEHVYEGGVALVSWVYGGNTSYRRKAICEAGMCDERFAGTACGEDTDLAMRVKSLGYKLLFDPSIKLIHLEETSGGCANRAPDQQDRRAEHDARLGLYFVFKHRKLLGRKAFIRRIIQIYRAFALSRPLLRRGWHTVLKRHLRFVSALRRARKCMADSKLPVIEE